jgi:hypothetical protein
MPLRSASVAKPMVNGGYKRSRPMANGEQANQDVSSDKFASGVDRIRETSKWIIVVFAAVAGVLTAGTQLSSIGQLEWGDERLNLAIGAAALGLLFVGVAVGSVVSVLTSGYTTLESLVKEETNQSQKSKKSGNVKFVEDNKLLKLTNFRNIEELRDEYYGSIEQRYKETDKAKIKELDAKIKYLGQLIEQILAAVKYDAVRRRFKLAMVVLFISGFVAAGAIGTFAWASNPPEQAADSGSATTTVNCSVEQGLGGNRETVICELR